MHPQALAQSATLALSAGTAAVSAAVGAITLAIAWFAHHKLAHRHRILDLLAKILMAAGATILFASPGARLLQGINTWSAGLLRDAARATQLTSNWPSSVGILTLIEIPLLLWAALHLWDAVQGRRAAHSSSGISINVRMPTLEGQFDVSCVARAASRSRPADQVLMPCSRRAPGDANRIVAPAAMRILASRSRMRWRWASLWCANHAIARVIAPTAAETAAVPADSARVALCASACGCIRGLRFRFDVRGSVL